MAEHLAQPRQITDHPARCIGIDLDREFHSLALDDRPEHLLHRPRQAAQLEHVARHHQAFALQIGEVEDIAQQRAHLPPGAVRLVDQPNLAFVQRGLADQCEQSENSVHRGAELVAHHRQEA